MRLVSTGALLMLAACQQQARQQPTPQPTATSADPSTAGPAAAAAPAMPRQIGTVSGLSAQTSALTGDVSGFQLTRTDFGTRVELAADTLFEFDKAALTPTARTNLQRAADQVRAGGTGAVIVTGYTDAKGDEAYNLTLSRQRAEAVVAWLRTQPGLAARAFEPTGKGEADPVAPNTSANGTDDPAGRAKNRRVVLDIPR